MKKNVLNRILSMALVLAMSLTLCVPAFATNDGGDWAKENESAGYSFAGRTEEVLLVDDGKGNLVEVTIIEDSFVSQSRQRFLMAKSGNQIGDIKKLTFQISNEALGLPGVVSGASSIKDLGVARQAAEITSNAVSAKLGSSFIPTVNFVAWLLGVAAFVNGLCGNRGIEVIITLEYRETYWHRENCTVQGWQQKSVSVLPY